MNRNLSSLIAVSLVAFVPTVSILFTLVLNDNELISQVFYFICKIWIFAVPTIWYIKIDRNRFSWPKTEIEGLKMATFTGIIMSTIILLTLPYLESITPPEVGVIFVHIGDAGSETSTLNIPSPVIASTLYDQSSPVPTYRIVGSLADCAIVEIAIFDTVVGVKLVHVTLSPEPSLAYTPFHNPPPTAPAYHVFPVASVASTTIALVLPGTLFGPLSVKVAAAAAEVP